MTTLRTQPGSSPPMYAMLRVVACLAVALGSGVAQDRTVHVRVDGKDAGDGSAARPVRSLTRAQELVRTTAGSVEVVLHAGVWRIVEPLRFGPDDGGDERRSVTWRAAGDGSVTISGGRVIGGWSVRDGGVWTTTLGEDWPVFRELFVGGARRPRARHPNDGFHRIVAAAKDRRTGFTFQPGDVPAIDDTDQVELLFLHDWSISRIRIGSIDLDAASLTTTDPIGSAAKHYAIDHFEPHPRYRLEGSRAFLDHPGEWHLDANTRELTYLPMIGETPDAVEVIAPIASRLLDVAGDDAGPVRNLHFIDIAFEHCAWMIPARGYAEGQANYHEPRTEESGTLRQILPAALRFERAEDCGIEGGHIAHLGGSGLQFGSRTARCSLARVTVTDLSGNGVLLGEDQHRRVDDEVWWKVAPEQIATELTVRDCRIEHCGEQFFGAVGIWVGFARGCRIEHNELRDLPYTGVSLGWVWDPTPTPIGDHLVHDNHIHHVMQLLSDGGGIYTLGRQPGTVLRGNRIHDVPANAGRAPSNGIFFDQGTTGLVVEDNVIWNVDRSPLRFHVAGQNVVRSNLLVLRGDVSLARYNRTEPDDITFEGNVVAREDTRDGR